MSTSSTVPSSTDVPVPDDAHPRKPPRVLSSARLSSEPEKQHTFSIRAAGRTFSFGSRAGKQPGSTVGQAADQPRISGSFGWGGRLGRERAMTESSYASTATPPKLSTDFVPVESASFAGIFDGIGDRRSLVMGQPGSSYDLERPGDASPVGPHFNISSCGHLADLVAGRTNALDASKFLRGSVNAKKYHTRISSTAHGRI